MQIFLLILAVIVLPIAYVALVFLMRAQRIDQPPVAQMFFLFGTIGGWVLASALSPSGLAAMCIIFLITAVPVVVVESVGLRAKKNRTIYHRIAIWSGFAYPAVLGLFIVLEALDRN